MMPELENLLANISAGNMEKEGGWQPMRLSGKYRIVVEGDIDALRIGYSNDGIGHLFQRLLTGEEAVMENLRPQGITVRQVSEDQDEFIAIPRMD